MSIAFTEDEEGLKSIDEQGEVKPVEEDFSEWAYPCNVGDE